MRLAPLLLLSALLCPAAWAQASDDQADLPCTADVVQNPTSELTFDLTVAGRPVGTQTVVIRYRPSRVEGGEETRVIEIYTELRATVAGLDKYYTSRQTARAAGRTMSFTSVVDENGNLREVQGRRRKDGQWTLVVNDGVSNTVTELRRSAANLCTLDLYDPLLHKILVDAPDRAMLVADTGVVVNGVSEELGEIPAMIGETEMTVERIRFEGSGLEMTFDWNLEGVPVAWEGRLLGLRVVARVKKAPVSRAWGTTSVSSRFDDGQRIEESEL